MMLCLSFSVFFRLFGSFSIVGIFPVLTSLRPL
nr:MAG TPA: hypothetical protein [Inoviridae sp.]